MDESVHALYLSMFHLLGENKGQRAGLARIVQGKVIMANGQANFPAMKRFPISLGLLNRLSRLENGTPKMAGKDRVAVNKCFGARK